MLASIDYDVVCKITCMPRSGPEEYFDETVDVYAVLDRSYYKLTWVSSKSPLNKHQYSGLYAYKRRLSHHGFWPL